jgi:hypothetical protein
VTKHLSDYDALQDLLILENALIDKGQQQLIERLRRHVRELWRHVQRLERALSFSQEELELRIGDSSLLMKKDGTIVIRGRDIQVRSTNRVEISGPRIKVEAAANLTLKGQKILQN